MTFEEKFSSQRAKIKDVKTLRAEDEMVDRYFQTADYIFARHADELSPNTLLRMGGALSSILPYFGQRAARTRADRDIFENLLSQEEKAITLSILDANSGYKVTQARAEASEMLSVKKNELVILEAIKNQDEALFDGCKTVIMFIQSILSQKKAERFTSAEMINNSTDA